MRLQVDDAAQAFARNYGARFNFMRTALGLTAADVARGLNVVPAAVSAWKRGEAVPGQYRAMQLQRYLKAVAKAKGLDIAKIRREARAAQATAQAAERAA